MQDAVAIPASGPFALTKTDVAFLDYETAEGLVGRPLAAWVRAVRMKKDGPKVVIISAIGDELLAVNMIRAGASDYIPKRHLNRRQLEIDGFA